MSCCFLSDLLYAIHLQSIVNQQILSRRLRMDKTSAWRGRCDVWYAQTRVYYVLHVPSNSQPSIWPKQHSRNLTLSVTIIRNSNCNKRVQYSKPLKLYSRDVIVFVVGVIVRRRVRIGDQLMARHRYRLCSSQPTVHGSPVGLVSQARYDDAWRHIVVHGVRLLTSVMPKCKSLMFLNRNSRSATDCKYSWISQHMWDKSDGYKSEATNHNLIVSTPNNNRPARPGLSIQCNALESDRGRSIAPVSIATTGGTPNHRPPISKSVVDKREIRTFDPEAKRVEKVKRDPSRWKGETPSEIRSMDTSPVFFLHGEHWATKNLAFGVLQPIEQEQVNPLERQLVISLF